MASNLRLWVFLQLALGCGSRKVRQLIEAFGDVESFFSAGYNSWYDSNLFVKNELDRLKSISFSDVDEILDSCRRLGYRIITPDCDEYPERLINIADYPAALYARGDIIDFDDEVAIAVVGTRMATTNGKRTANALAHQLAKSGALIVSGGANGIDAAALEGAIIAGGRAVAVLGCGINTRYLMHHEQLRNTISKNGVLLSEYPPGTPVYPASFPIRNRIMSALSLGTLVVEAAQSSGSLITAKHAIDQGRDVFAVPGSIMSELSKGCNRLISEGAKPVTKASDILEEYIDLFPHKINIRIASDNLTPKPIKRQPYIPQSPDNRVDAVNAPAVTYSSFVPSPPEAAVQAKLTRKSGERQSVEDLEALYSTSLGNTGSETFITTGGKTGIITRTLDINTLFKGFDRNELLNGEMGRVIEKMELSRLQRMSENEKIDADNASSAPKRRRPSAQNIERTDGDKAADNSKAPPEMTAEQLEIINAMSSDALHIDEISNRVGRPTRELGLILTELEIAGIIKSLPGRRFCKK